MHDVPFTTHSPSFEYLHYDKSDEYSEQKSFFTIHLFASLFKVHPEIFSQSTLVVYT